MVSALTTASILAAVLALTVCPPAVLPGSLAAAAILLSATEFGRTIAQRARGRPELTGLEPAVLAILALLLLFVLPLPESWAAVFGPLRQSQNRAVAETLGRAAALRLLPREAYAFAATRNRAGSLRILLTAVAMSGAAFGAARLPPSGKLRLLRVLVFLGFATACAGIAGRLRYPQGDTLWWIYPVPHGLPGPLAGSVNPNHFAALLAMLAPVALCLAIGDLEQHRWLHLSGNGLALFAFGAGILLSYSRGALLALGASLLAVCTALVLRRRFVKAALLAAACAAALVAAPRLPFPAVGERLQSLRSIRDSDSYRTRVNAWRDSLRIWRAYPLLGAGPNAFRMVYPQHRTTSTGAFMTHPENQYVQALTDTGIVGTLLAIWLVAALARRLRKERIPADGFPAVSAAVAGALVAAAAHALVEFALHIPLYAVSLCAVAGTGLRTAAGTRRARLALVQSGLALSAAIVVSSAWMSGLRLDAPSVIAAASPRDVVRAVIWAPTSWHAWSALGRAVAATQVSGAAELGEQCLAQAAAYDPNNYRLWKALGEMRLNRKDYTGAREAFARVRALRDWVPVPEVPEARAP